MTKSPAAPKIIPLIERLHTFAAKLPRKDAPQLAEDLDTFRTDVGEMLDSFTDFTAQVEAWCDDDNSRDERADAKEEVDQAVNELESHLLTLAGVLTGIAFTCTKQGLATEVHPNE
jgi:4-alpha-glucanotransferase